ncbi:MAG: hypothetical protein QM755_23385 [Luteolibacter sp.]
MNGSLPNNALLWKCNPYIVRAISTLLMTKITRICCQGCGADLDVREDVRFLNCNYCHAKLEVVREVSSTHTRVLEKIEQTTDRIAGNLRVIELQNELERVDREWESKRQSLMMRGKHGSVYRPSVATAVIGGGVPIVGGLIFASFVGGHTMGYFPLIGLAFSCIGFMNLVSGLSKATELRDGKARYERLRDEILEKMENERGM